MNSKTLKHLRVVVHVNDEHPDEQYDSFKNTDFKCGVKAGLKRNRNGQVLVPSSPYKSTLNCLNDNLGFDNMKAEVVLIDEKSLQLNLISTEDCGPYTNISHKMHFDHASYSTVDMVKCELATVMDDLLLKRKNSCIIRFASKQQMDITIFFDLLVRLLIKRTYYKKYKLLYVKLECLNIAANGQATVNQSLPCNEKGFAVRANLVDKNDVNCSNTEATYSSAKDSKNQFYSTRDLFLWLLSEYRFKFSDNKGHEKLIFSFALNDHRHNPFKVKLTFFNILLDFMNTDDRNHWHRYMDHMGEGCQGTDCKFVHSGLTLSLSNYIEGIPNENSLLLFDVPTNIKRTADTIEMLQMAHSVVKNRTRKLLLLSNNINFSLRLPSSSVDCSNPKSPQGLLGQSQNDLPTNYKRIRRSSLPVSIERQSRGMSLCDKTYFKEDFNALSGWYRKIDECFEKNRQLREKYFSRYFNLKTKNILSNIKNMFKLLESLCMEQNEPDLIGVHEDQIEMHELFESYHDSLIQFRQISEDIKATDFEDILKIYLETKKFDLDNYALTLKQKYLKLCRQYLNSAFDNLHNNILEYEI